MSFPLLVHSHYSVGQAFCHPDKLVAKAVKLGLPAIALTDKHTLSGVPEFLQTVQKQHDKGKTIKPVVGCQFRLLESYWITLYAKNSAGWKNLIKILGSSYLNSNGDPEVTLQSIVSNPDGLFCAIGGPNSLHKHPDFKTFLPDIQKAFGKNLFKIKIDNGIPSDEEINAGLNTASNTVTTTPVYYIEKDDQICQQILICGHYQKTFENHQEIFETDPFAKTFWDTDNNYLHDVYPSVPSTFLDQIETFAISAKPNIPKYCDDSPKFLADLCREGWKTRQIQAKCRGDKNLYQIYADRIKMELGVFTDPKLVLADYMLIIYDIMKFIRESGSLAGLRGSASACLLSYLTGISDVDPVVPDPTLPYHPGRALIFERFFNKGRVDSGKISFSEFSYEDFQKECINTHADK